MMQVTSKVEMLWGRGSADLAETTEGRRRPLSNFWLYFKKEFIFPFYFKEEFFLSHLKNEMCVTFVNVALKYDYSLYSF